MAINQKQVLSLQQKLSPQQIQMIKLLELPTVQLEQRIKQEIENNIVLEEEERRTEDEEQQPQEISVDEYLREDETPSYKSRINNYSKDDKQRPVYLFLLLWGKHPYPVQQPGLVYRSYLLRKNNRGLPQAAVRSHQYMGRQTGFTAFGSDRGDNYGGAEPVSHLVLQNQNRTDTALF